MRDLTFQKALLSSRAFAVMQREYEKGLGNAYMVVSPDDEAVKEFFSLVACLSFCPYHTPCLDCNECKKVLHGNHPDVLWYNREGETIKVADVGELTSSTDLMSFSGNKTYFVCRADKMNPASQNKLLKTLEEPPSGVSIFLGVSNESAMLDTVKSRCNVIHIDSFDHDTIVETLLDLGCSAQNAQIAASCSEGMLGKACRIAKSPDYVNLYSSTIFILGKIKKSTDILSIDRAPAITRQPDEFLNVLSVIFRDMLAVKCGEEVFSKHVGLEVQKLSQDYSKRAIAEIILLINNAKRKLSLNVNMLATLDWLLFSILEVKYKWQQ